MSSHSTKKINPLKSSSNIKRKKNYDGSISDEDFEDNESDCSDELLEPKNELLTSSYRKEVIELHSDSEDKTRLEKQQINQNLSIQRSDSKIIPLYISKAACKNKILLCQTDDKELTFEGELGAVGRMNVTNESLNFDLKGKLYTGQIYGTSTVLMVNVKTIAKENELSTIGNIEGIVNEVCHLTATSERLQMSRIADNEDYENDNQKHATHTNEEKKNNSKLMISTITRRSRGDKKKSTKKAKK